MTVPGDRAADATLFQRWRDAARATPQALEPDPILLAAYAEGKLGEDAAEAVEEWLYQNPEALADLKAAREANVQALPTAPADLFARLAALVPGSTETGGAVIVPFPARAPRRENWRVAAMWSGLAASLLVTGLLGFSIGSDAYLQLNPPAAATSDSAASADLFDQPIGIFEANEDSAT